MATADAGVGGPDEAAILARFGLRGARPLGAGGESRVFALDDGRVLRIFHPAPVPRSGWVDALVAGWDGIDLGFGLPVVLDAGRLGSQDFTIDRRIPGTDLLAVLAATPSAPRRRALLAEALDVVGRLQTLPLPEVDAGFRQVGVPDAPTFASLAELLDERMDFGIAVGGGALARLVPDLDAQRARMRELLATRDVTPAFVHHDICPANLMATPDHVTGVVDVSVHALAADPVMDLVGLQVMLGRYPGSDEDGAWLAGVLRERLGDRAWLVDVHARHHAAYYSMDPACLPWCAQVFARPW